MEGGVPEPAVVEVKAAEPEARDVEQAEPASETDEKPASAS
jgi:hypothetical protein